MAVLLILMSVIVGVARSASAQTAAEPTYWLGRSTGTEYVFDTQIPAQLGAMLTATGSKFAPFTNLPVRSSEVIDGETYNFVKTGISWDNNLVDSGTVAYNTGGGLVQGNWWVNMDTTDPEWQAFLPTLKTLVTPRGTWKHGTLYVLISEGTETPTVAVPIPMETQLKVEMQKLAESTTAGAFYPQVQVPADMDAYVLAMLAYGNAGSRRPRLPQDEWFYHGDRFDAGHSRHAGWTEQGLPQQRHAALLP